MKSITFTEAMFPAVINGTETMTRRIMKQQPTGVRNSVFVKSGFEDNHGNELKPRYKVGETVYLKEPYYMPINIFGQEVDNGQIIYKFDEELSESKSSWTLKNKLFMPEKYARYFIEITDVRCERLQDISDEDCLKEGIIEREKWSLGKYYQYEWNGKKFQTTQEAYAALIDSINGRGAWERNPYVWIYEFKLINNK